MAIKGKQAVTSERKLEGKIIWLSQVAVNLPKSDKQWIYTAQIKDAVLTSTGLSFSAICGPYSYKVWLARTKDTNFSGKMYLVGNGETYEYPAHLQVFENRLGLLLEGNWDEESEDDGLYWVVIHLYYTDMNQ